MKIKINVEEALMLDAMKQMRKVYRAEGEVEAKSQKIQSIFAGLMTWLDAAGIK